MSLRHNLKLLSRKLTQAFRVMMPSLFVLAFASVAHAQGTMDFSGAQTLMGTFKTFAVYAGAVICFRRSDLRRHSDDERSLPGCHSGPLRRAVWRWRSRMGRGLDWLTHRAVDVRSCHAHAQTGRTVSD